MIICESIVFTYIFLEKQRMDLARADPKANPLKDILPQHIDHKATETFGQDDLERLIQHASKDLDELDREREKEFKDYEMRKEYERRAELSVRNIFLIKIYFVDFSSKWMTKNVRN